LNIGVKLTLRFAISEVPIELIRKLYKDSKVRFNFDDIDSVDYSVSVVYKTLAQPKPQTQPVTSLHDDC
jgi:hypothetical protein